MMNGSNHVTLLNVYPIERALAQDDEIVAAAKAGSHVAFAEIHAIYSKRLYRTIIEITKCPEDAEDALQDTFLRVYLAIHTFEGRSSIYSWLTRIAINSALMVLRKRRTRSEMLFDRQPDLLSEAISFEIKDSAPDPEQAYDLRQRRVKVQSAMLKLNVGLRGPVLLRMAKGASIKDIAEALNISEQAVKARLYRARMQITAACRKS